MSQRARALEQLIALAKTISLRIKKLMTYRLIYKSDAGAELDDAELRSVAMFSALSNQSEGIAGLLLHYEGHIMQVLEGPKKAVTSLYERIEKDPRHHSVECLSEGECKEPAFETWSMGYRPVKSQGEMDMFFALSRGKLATIIASANSNVVKDRLKDYLQKTGM